MIKKSAFVLILLAAAAAASTASFAPQDKIDVTGSWEVKFETPMGERTYKAVFVQEGEIVKVIMKSEQGTEMKSEGTLKGSDIAWTVVVTGPMGEIPLAFKGKVEGETISGTVAIADNGDAEFKAKRVK
ncbi:MAG: hypothetical protein PHI34_13445 [Acidobacteriota bacterium]|nr:hypothetical protein [Acidobacteriota bacterium]